MRAAGMVAFVAFAVATGQQFDAGAGWSALLCAACAAVGFLVYVE